MLQHTDVPCTRCDSDNVRIITGGDDGLARVWNVASLLDERTDCAKKGAVVSLAAPVRSNWHGATPCVPEVNAARLASEKAWAACGDGVAVRWDINAQPATPVKSSRGSASAANTRSRLCVHGVCTIASQACSAWHP